MLNHNIDRKLGVTEKYTLRVVIGVQKEVEVEIDC